MNKRIVVLLAFVFLLLEGVLAQTKVSGTVVSQEDGEPVIGASVVVEGQKTGVITDFDGHFTIDVVSGKKLVISYIGMETVTVASSAGADAFLEHNASTGYNTATLKASNWPGHTLGGFFIRSSRGNGMVVQNLLQLAEPVIMRVGAEGETIN